MKKKFATVLLAMLAGSALAQQGRIEQVLVFPGGATVERSVPLKAGQRELKLSCLPARFDADSLQLVAPPGVNLGEISVQTVERAAVPECATSPLDARIRELEDQQAALAAESSALDLQLGYLKTFGNARESATAQIAATTEALRRNGLDALHKQHTLARQREDKARELAPLLAERKRLATANPQLRTLVVKMAAAKDGELRLSYRLNQAGWEPVYRAYLDSETGKVRLERHAQVAQSSGEDWTGVRLKLSTAQPRQGTNMQPPYPWTLDLLPPEPPRQLARTLAAPAPMMMAKSTEMAADAAPPPSDFDVSVFEGEFATEFEVPGKVDVAATGQRVAFALGTTPLDATLMARANPQAEPAAYLVAESARPAGVWPAGALQLYRDGTFVGNSRLTVSADERFDLYFGRDDKLLVTIDPEARNAGSTGFIGTRAEQKIGHGYTVENKHQKPIAVQVLEAAPVAQHEDIKVQASFDPKPATTAWRKQPGIAAWEFTMQPGATQKLRADYTISYPKDARIGGMR